MKKITSVLILLFIMLFTINVKAGDIHEIYTIIEKGESSGELYNSMPTEVEKGETISVKLLLKNAQGWPVSYGYSTIHWDREAFELEETNGKYYVVQDNNLYNFDLELSAENNSAQISYAYPNPTENIESDSVYLAELKFKVKDNAPNGYYQISQDFKEDGAVIEVGNSFDSEVAFAKTLKYQVGKQKVTSNLTKTEIEDIDGDVYIIGNHMFTRNNGDQEYKGVLTTEYIMLASKSIESNEKSAMKIITKDLFGDWRNAINDDILNDVEDSFKISYIDMIPNYAENGVYANASEDTMLRLIQINDKEAIVTIENASERVHGIANINNRVATLTASGYTYQITITDDSVTISTGDANITSRTLQKKTNLSLNDYYNNAFTEGVYDGHGSPTYYLKSAHTAKYTSANYEIDLLRTSQHSARICLKAKGENTCIVSKYAYSNEGANHAVGSSETTYAFEYNEGMYGIKWTNGKITVVQLDGTTNSSYLGDYNNTSEITMEDAFHIWEKSSVSYAVTFDSNNGNDPYVTYVEKGTAIDSGEFFEPGKDDYIFIEWQLNNATFDYDTLITGPITLVAKYATLPSGGTLIISPQGVGHDYYSYANDIFTYKLSIETTDEYDGFFVYDVLDTVNPISSTPQGEPAGTPAEVEVVTNATKTIYAKPYILVNGVPEPGTNSTELTIHPVKYTVTFNSSGGSSVPSQSVPYGGFATAPENNPNKVGFSFEGWLYNDSPFDFENTRINSDIELFAAWENDIPTPNLGDTLTTNYYQHRLYLQNLTDYCDDPTQCSGTQGEYKITGFEIYEVVNNEKVNISFENETQFAPYQYVTLTATPNAVKRYVARAYIKELVDNEYVTAYSEYSTVYEIDTTLQAPTIAYKPYGGTYSDEYEVENWIEVTNLMSAFGHNCLINTCDDYKVYQFELYEKVDNDYNAVGTISATGLFHITGSYGDLKHYYVRGIVQNGANPIYTPYSDELVFNPTIAAPIITRATSGMGGENPATGYQPLRYNDDEAGFDVDFSGDYSPHMVCNPNDDTDCHNLVDDYEWFAKNGETLTTLYDGGFTGEATITLAEGTTTTVVAKAYVVRTGDVKVHGPESNQVVIDLSNPTYTFVTEVSQNDPDVVLVKAYINAYEVQIDGIEVAGAPYADLGEETSFSTNASVLENIDTITLKLSDNKTVTATRAN